MLVVDDNRDAADSLACSQPLDFGNYSPHRDSLVF
jgi:hypothetical protein